jgi:hypothetical protein
MAYSATIRVSEPLCRFQRFSGVFSKDSLLVGPRLADEPLAPSTSSRRKGLGGLAIGVAGTHFVTVGTNYIHSYSVNSTGGIGGQVSQINSALYYGAECGTTAGGAIDHTSEEVYVQTAGAPDWCNSLQTYKVDSKTGVLTFDGASEFQIDDRGGPASFFTLAPNNAHAYYIAPEYMSCGGTISSFYRDRYGVLYSAPSNRTGPSFPGPDGQQGYFYPSSQANIAADSTSHLAVALFQDVMPPCDGVVGPVQLASYTVDSYGNLASTNKGASMVVPNVYPTSLSISPSGNLLAIGARTGMQWFDTKYSAGLQVFHFSGGSPITKYSAVLTTTPIDGVAWDKSNHLFAISKSGKKLYVYTVTATTIVQAPGSPYTVSSPSTLFIKPL